MSIITVADEALQELRGDVDSAIRNIDIILDSNTWGSGEYSDEFKSKLAVIYGELYLIKVKLK